MKKGRLAILIIGVLIIIGAEIYGLSVLARNSAKPAEPEPTPTATPILLTPTPAPTTEPEPVEETASEEASAEASEEASQEASAEPTPTAEPTATPEPSATPEPESSSELQNTSSSELAETNGPVPTDQPDLQTVTEYGTLLNSGYFTSNTGLSLNLNIFWAAYDNGTDDVTIQLIGTLTSGNVQHGPHSYGAQIDYNGETSYAATNTVIVDSYGIVESDLFTTTITVPKGTDGLMSVSFDYGGTYSGVSIPTITAVGTVTAAEPTQEADGTVHYTSEHD